MGKLEQQQHVVHENNNEEEIGTILLLCCPSCSKGITRVVNLKCIVVLILGIAIFSSAVFWVLPFHNINSGFDAKAAIKNSATVQAFFKLQMPVSPLIPQIGTLEYDITGEIGVPYTKVVILSMHEDGASNYTNVVFGVLSDPMNGPINPVFLSLLKSSLIELFLQRSNLTFTISNSGRPSFFEILKFPGGITVIPSQSASIWQIQQTLFNFTLSNSISEIQEYFVEFKEQLKIGLHLKSYENVFVQITNEEGSTIGRPVTVQASVMSDLGILLPQRLKQLAQTITRSPSAKNLGLNNTVFGRVKGISLSSYLKGTLHSTPPTPSPAPAPELNDYAEPYTSTAFSPSPSSLAPSPTTHPIPCHNCGDHYPHASSPHSNSPAHPVKSFPPLPCPYEGSVIPPVLAPSPHVDSAVPPHSDAHNLPPISTPTSHLSPNMPPLPAVSYVSTPGQDDGIGEGTDAPSVAPSPFALSMSSSPIGRSFKQIQILSLFALLIFNILCRLY